MKRSPVRSLPTLLVLVALCFGLLAAEIRCQQAEARPSVAELQDQVDRLTNAVCVLYALQGLPLTSLCGGDRLVFVTSQAYTGNLGGLEGADQICNDLAIAAGIPAPFKAWLARGTDENPASRFVRSDVPYVLLDGTPVALDWDDLTDGEILSPIAVDELGATHPSGWVRSGVAIDGTSTPASQCLGWTSDDVSSSGFLGRIEMTGPGWTQQAGRPCSEAYPLYCFEQ